MEPAEIRHAEAECIRLTTAFAVHLDSRRYEEVADLFTVEALYNPRGTPYRGRRQILEYLHGRPALRRSRHVITNQFVRVTGPGTATGECVLLYFVHEDPLAELVPAPLAGIELVGDYLDRFVLTDDGWRIAERIGRVVFQRGGATA
ncbi:MAG: nuclear transport factor 2 family protein [Rhizobiales bacterium]|nr:nuclear transport factor 2 family protein [Hyphomicrobiales bacterium]